MKKQTLLILALFSGLFGFSQGWEFTYGPGLTNYESRDLEPTPDGGCLLVGTGFDFGPVGPKKLVLLKLDQDGESQWIKEYGDIQGNWSGQAIDQNDNSEFLVTGSVGMNTLVAKFDSVGDTVWTTTFEGGNQSSSGKDIKFASNGNILLVYKNGNDNETISLLQPDGAVIWSYEFQITEGVTLQALVETDNGDVIVTGDRFSQIFFARISSTGNLLWQSSQSLGEGDIVNDIIALGNDQYAFSGSIAGFAGNSPIFGFLDGVNGNIGLPGVQTIPVELTNGSVQGMTLLADGGIALTLIVNNLNPQPTGVIVRLDNQYQFDWYTALNGESLAFAFAVEQSDQGYIMGTGVANGQIYTVKLDAQGNLYTNQIQGNVFFDADGLCDTPDGGFNPLQNWLVTATSPDHVFSTLSEVGGNYSLTVDTGSYIVETFPPNAYWAMCDAPAQLSFNAFYDTLAQNFPIERLIDCPVLSVDISTTFLRRCFDNTYYLHACNQGTQDADAATVEVVLDPFIDYLSSSITPVAVSGDTLIFDLGIIGIGECVNISILVNVDCNAVLGQTHCTSAHIRPDSICLPADPLWDMSSTRVYAVCESDSLRFFIENAGEGNMSGPREYLIVEDDVMYLNGNYELNSGQATQKSVPASGSTWRLEAEQADGHPGNSMPSVTVEGCLSTSSPFSTGFVRLFPQDDGDSFRDIDCQENIGAYDPNDKQATPVGYSDAHYTEANTDLEYKIRFQNTGTDTAFTVVVRDTLSEELDITSLVMGSSSHQYRYNIIDGNVLKVTFDNIMLPDSNVNEPASNGYFKFRIRQMPDLPIGTILENSAAIYFDFNLPIITNIVFHEIGEDFLPTSIEEGPIMLEQVMIRISPNPFSSQTRIEVLSDRHQEFVFRVYDALGRVVDQRSFTGNVLEYGTSNLQKGIYFYEILSDKQRIQTGKMIRQ